jgi:hypothetical protein
MTSAAREDHTCRDQRPLQAFEVLNMIAHLRRLHDLVDQHQAAHHVTHGCLLSDVDDSGVPDAGCGKTQEVGVLGEDDPTL